MLRILKKVFGQSGRAEAIPFSTVDMWFEKQIKENTTLIQDVSGFYAKMDEAVRLIYKQLLELGGAEPPQDISPDHVSVLEEHKKAIVSKMQDVVEDLSIPAKRDSNTVLAYSELLSISLDKLNRMRSQLESFEKYFSAEVNAVAQSILSMSDMKDVLNNIISGEHGIIFVHDTKRRIKNIQNKEEALARLKDELEREDIRLQEVQNHKIKLETEIDNLRTTYEYEKFDQLVSKKIKLEKELEREQGIFKTAFAPIARLFAAYDEKEFGADRVLARQYASDPANTLLNDKNLWLLNLMEVASAKLPELEPDERKQIKVKEAITVITKEYLNEFLSKCNALNNAMQVIKRQIRMNATTTKIEDIKYKLRHIDEQIRGYEESKAKILEAMEEQNTEKDLLMLEKQLSSLTQIRLT
jgi:hypothetical protein